MVTQHRTIPNIFVQKKSLSRFNCSVDVLEQKTYAGLGSLALKIYCMFIKYFFIYFYLLSLGIGWWLFGFEGIVYYIYFCVICCNFFERANCNNEANGFLVDFSCCLAFFLLKFYWPFPFFFLLHPCNSRSLSISI